MSKHKKQKDTIILAELSRVYYQLQHNLITREQANEMLKLTNLELNDFDTQEINSIKQEIKQKENLIYNLFNEIQDLQEQLKLLDNNKNNN